MMTTSGDGANQCCSKLEYINNSQDNDPLSEEVIKLQESATLTTSTAVMVADLQLNSMASPNLLNVIKINDDNRSDDQITTKSNHILNENELAVTEATVTRNKTTPECEQSFRGSALDPTEQTVPTTNCDCKFLDTSSKMCQTPWENPQRQSLILLNLRRRLAEQEDVNKRLRLEKDSQLKEVTKALLILETQLRREQHHIHQILEEKDKKISEQEKHIKALLTLNRKLAANRHRAIDKKHSTFDSPVDKKHVGKTPKRQQRKISWHNEVHVITDYDLHWTTTNSSSKILIRSVGESDSVAEEQRVGHVDNKSCMKESLHLTNGDPNLDNNCRTEGDDSKFNTISEVQETVDLSSDISEACDALNFDLQESESDYLNSTDVIASSDKATRDVHAGDVQPQVFNNSCLFQDNSTTTNTTKKDSATHPPSLGTYNRVMSNHRSVTKPKDVKYRKISRVKSRSLEELRGRLKQHHLTLPGVREGSVVLESSEEL